MILVTGGTGLVGSHLLYQLTKENDKIRAIYRSENKLEKVKQVFASYQENSIILFHKIDWVKADITDIPSLETVFNTAITQVYHCAAIVTFNPKYYQQMRRVNIEGTANIVNFCISNSIEKICHVSSIATLGDSINGKIISEENEWNNTSDNCYAITKHGAEMEVWRASQEGIETIIVNPGVILGSGFYNEGSGKIFSTVYKGFPFFTEGVTGFVGVKDVVLSMIKLMSSTITNERFILVAENCEFKTVLWEIAEALGKKKPSFKIGKFSLECLWRLEKFITSITKKEPLITKSSAKASYQKEYFSSEKLIDAIDYSFVSVSHFVMESLTINLFNFLIESLLLVLFLFNSRLVFLIESFMFNSLLKESRCTSIFCFTCSKIALYGSILDV